MEKEIADYDEEQAALENPHNPHYWHTVDASEEYNGMFCQMKFSNVE